MKLIHASKNCEVYQGENPQKGVTVHRNGMIVASRSGCGVSVGGQIESVPSMFLGFLPDLDVAEQWLDEPFRED